MKSRLYKDKIIKLIFLPELCDTIKKKEVIIIIYRKAQISAAGNLSNFDKTRR